MIAAGDDRPPVELAYARADDRRILRAMLLLVAAVPLPLVGASVWQFAARSLRRLSGGGGVFTTFSDNGWISVVDFLIAFALTLAGVIVMVMALRARSRGGVKAVAVACFVFAIAQVSSVIGTFNVYGLLTSAGGRTTGDRLQIMAELAVFTFSQAIVPLTAGWTLRRVDDEMVAGPQTDGGWGNRNR